MELLEVTHVKKQFKTVQAVKDISFNVKEGEILGLLGPNGAGKSTTISMISTLLKPDSGDIVYNGQSVIKKPEVIQENLGYVPQEIALYQMLSGKENLEFWGKAYGLRGKALKEAIEDVSEIIGIKERLTDKVKNYSGGMQRRLNIGVALLHNPELIIMDEPTVGIDPQSRMHILDTVLRLNKEKGMTVIYTSHYMEEVDYLCNRICIMDKGQIRAQGTKEALIRDNNPTIQIDVKVDGKHEKASKAIRQIKGITKVDIVEGRILMEAYPGENVYSDFIEVMKQQNIHILSMDTREANLEAVFLQLTGRELRD